MLSDNIDMGKWIVNKFDRFNLDIRYLNRSFSFKWVYSESLTYNFPQPVLASFFNPHPRMYLFLIDLRGGRGTGEGRKREGGREGD